MAFPGPNLPNVLPRQLRDVFVRGGGKVPNPDLVNQWAGRLLNAYAQIDPQGAATIRAMNPSTRAGAFNLATLLVPGGRRGEPTVGQQAFLDAIHESSRNNPAESGNILSGTAFNPNAPSVLALSRGLAHQVDRSMGSSVQSPGVLPAMTPVSEIKSNPMSAYMQAVNPMFAMERFLGRGTATGADRAFSKMGLEPNLAHPHAANELLMLLLSGVPGTNIARIERSAGGPRSKAVSKILKSYGNVSRN